MLHYKFDPKYIKSAIKPNNSHAAAQCYQNFHKRKNKRKNTTSSIELVIQPEEHNCSNLKPVDFYSKSPQGQLGL